MKDENLNNDDDDVLQRVVPQTVSGENELVNGGLANTLKLRERDDTGSGVRRTEA